MKSTKYYVANKNVVKRNVVGRHLLIPLIKLQNEEKTDSIFVLNETGNFIWETLDKKVSKQQIIDSIMRKFINVDKLTVKKDLDNLLYELIKRHLIDEVE